MVFKTVFQHLAQGLSIQAHYAAFDHNQLIANIAGLFRLDYFEPFQGFLLIREQSCNLGDHFMDSGAFIPVVVSIEHFLSFTGSDCMVAYFLITLRRADNQPGAFRSYRYLGLLSLEGP